jgi:hypothetical protein
VESSKLTIVEGCTVADGEVVPVETEHTLDRFGFGSSLEQTGDEMKNAWLLTIVTTAVTHSR